MMRSLYSGISGLRNHQTRMDVIGNNISNVNTAGYKAARVIFQDIFSQNVAAGMANQENIGGTNPKQIGLGIRLSSVDVIHTNAAFGRTDKETDMMINGDGFFVVMQVNPETGLNEYLYTRAGNFTIDSDGYLVTSHGYYVMGYNTELEMGVIDPGQLAVEGQRAYAINAGDGIPAGVTIPMGYFKAGDFVPAGLFGPGEPADNLIIPNVPGAEYPAENAVTAIPYYNYTDLSSTAALRNFYEVIIPAGDPIPAGTVLPAGYFQPGDWIPYDLFGPGEPAQPPGSTETGYIMPATPPMIYPTTDASTAAAYVDINGDPVAPRDVTKFYAKGDPIPAGTKVPLDYFQIGDFIPNGLYPGFPSGSEPWQVEYPAGTPIGIILTEADLGALAAAVAVANDPNTGTGIAAAFTVPATGAPWNLNVEAVDEQPFRPPTFGLVLGGPDPNADANGLSRIRLKTDNYCSVPDWNDLTAMQRASLQTMIATGNIDDLPPNFFDQFPRETFSLPGFGVADNGDVSVLISNKSMVIGRIGIAMFANPEGLEKAGGSLYRESASSGAVIMTEAYNDGAGEINAGGLEMSNVDLADQFTDMIVTQRGFQANSRIITVSDTMLEELVNLKR